MLTFINIMDAAVAGGAPARTGKVVLADGAIAQVTAWQVWSSLSGQLQVGERF
jgi:hypothetical protein